MMKKATIWSPLYATCVIWTVEVTGVSFSDSAPVPKFLNPGPSIFQIWESDSCSESGYNHQSNLNLPIFLLKKWQHRLLLLPKLKNDSGPFFPKFLTPVQIRSEGKTQNPQKSWRKKRRNPVSSEISDLCEISDLLLFFLLLKIKELSSAISFLMCVV